MIKINTNHITDIPLKVDGVEDAAVLELTGVDAPKPGSGIRYDLSASLAGRDLLVTGTAELIVNTECGRCLEPVTAHITAKKICHLYEGVAGQEVDITGDIREDILLEIPFLILCKPDCKGLCTGCGANLNTEACLCNHKKETEKEEEDSPWAALSGLKIEDPVKKTKTKKAGKK